MGEIPGNTVGGKAAIGPLAFWLLSIVDQPPSPKTAAGERTANLVKITHTTTAGLSSHPCKPSSYTGGVWWGRCRRRISILGSYQARKAAASHMADPAPGGHEPISSRPAYSAFSLIKPAFPDANMVYDSSAGTGHSTSPSLSVHETWKIGPWTAGMCRFLGGMECS